MSQKARWEHSCVVQDQKVARAQVFGHARKGRVLDLPAVSMQHEQARLAPHGGRLLRNQLIRKIEVEVADRHDLTFNL